MAKLLDYVRGDRSASKPSHSGVYLVRQSGGDMPWVLYWEVDAWSPFGTAATLAGREFFHLEGDKDGEPTRWDDPRVAATARRNGWREAVPKRR